MFPSSWTTLIKHSMIKKCVLLQNRILQMYVKWSLFFVDEIQSDQWNYKRWLDPKALFFFVRLELLCFVSVSNNELLYLVKFYGTKWPFLPMSLLTIIHSIFKEKIVFWYTFQYATSGDPAINLSQFSYFHMKYL